MKLPSLIAVTLLSAVPVAAQRGEVAAGPRFEVASVKQATIPVDVLANLNKLGTCGLTAFEQSGSRVRVSYAPLCSLIRLAYNVVDYQVVGVPRDFAQTESTNWFEIDAQTAAGAEPTIDQARVMLQTLLAEWFQLRVHREPREMAVLALVVARGGPTFRPCSNPDAPSVFTPGRLDSCRPPRFTMARMSQFLTRETGRPVIDRTGIADAAFELRYLPDGATALPDSPPSLSTALEEQLSLKLESQRAPVDTIVIDSVARPTQN